MDVSKWSSSRSRTITFGRRSHKRLESSIIDPPVAAVEGESKNVPKWKRIWKKLMREKKKFKSSVHNNQQQIPYDEYTYTQNFDQGATAAWDEPDVLSRSFSARFSDPSSIFRRRE